MRKYVMLKSIRKLEKVNPRFLVAVFLCCGLLAGLIGYDLLYKEKNVKEKEVHYHAGFKVFIDGKQVDFSDFKYMSVKPCTTEEHDEDDNDSKIHLHDGNGHVVHIHADGFKWGDLFKSLNYSFDPAKPIKGFINGEETSDILNMPIVAYDSIVILAGNAPQEIDISKASVTKDDIIKAEKLSESCGKP